MHLLLGGFAAFREDSADLYRPLKDNLDVPSIYLGKVASLIRSKDRQSIIDFIIGSRIRDSGAELGETTDLGKKILARVPLHMHRKLDSIFRVWVFFWRRENWLGDSGEELGGEDSSRNDDEEPFECEESRAEQTNREVPNWFTRFLVGAFHQPLDAIEEYFGEQVTFYFAWLQHCALHLLVLTFFGVIVTICQFYTDGFDHPIRPFYSMVVMVWTFLVLVNWRKRSNYLAYRWGSMDHEVQETPRPEFHGEYVVDEITQEWVVKYPKWKRWLKYFISVPISVAFTFTVLLLILLVHANRDLQMARYVNHLNNNTTEEFKFELSLDNIGMPAPIVEVEITKELLLDPTFWVVMGALPAMLGLCIPIMNLLLMKVSVILNNFENYRTESEYRTHLIIKVFSFRFVSQFGTVYYYALIATSADIKDRAAAIENGILRMGTSLMIYTTVAHWWQIFLQVYIFMLVRNIRRFLYRRKLRQELQKIEREEDEITTSLSDAEARQNRIISKRMLLDQAQDEVWFELMNPPHDSFPEYINAVVQFSFVACFSVVMPITPLFVLFNYLLNIRFDAYKLCRGRQRPVAKRTGGIGIWEHLLHIVAVIAVLTNCFLIAFTSEDFKWLAGQFGNVGIFSIVVMWEHVMLLIKFIMQNTISRFPKSVRDEIKRERHRLDQQKYSTMRTKTYDRRSQFQRSGAQTFSNLSPMMKRNEGTSPVRNRKMYQTPEPSGYLQTIRSTDDDDDDDECDDNEMQSKVLYSV